MDYNVIRALLKNGPSASGERFILLVIATHADPTGYCWPLVATLACECGMSGRNVLRLIGRS